MRDLVLVRCAEPAALPEVLEHALAAIAEHAAGELEIWRHDRAGLALVQSQIPGAAEKVALHRTRDQALGYSGFVGEPDEVAASFSFGDAPRLSRSPGGIATYFAADASRRRIAAWSSHAGMEGPYITVGARSTAISNRPLLSHLIGRQARRPAFSLEWARRALLGPSLWDETAFEGTRQAPPRAAVIAGDDVRFAPHPVALPRRYRKGDPAGIDALAGTALAAVTPLRRWPRGTLHLSGGKDSRFAAALVHRAGIDIELVTHSGEGEGEGASAAAVARVLGLPHRTTGAAGIAEGDDLLPTILDNLRATDGLIAEARHLAYRPVPHAGEPLVEGQGHAVRGGRRVKLLPRDAIRPQLVGFALGAADLVSGELGDQRRRRLDEILDGYPVTNPLELAYWFPADWTVTRGMTAPYRAAARARPVLYPMMDERVLLVCAALPAGDRALETAFYAALCRIAPALAPVPLHESTWRFDAGPIGERLFPAGRPERCAPFRERGRRRTPERKFDTIQPLFRTAMHDLGSGREIARLVEPEVLRALCDEPDPALALGRPHMQIINFMWRATALALVCEGTWLQAS